MIVDFVIRSRPILQQLYVSIASQDVNSAIWAFTLSHVPLVTMQQWGLAYSAAALICPTNTGRARIKACRRSSRQRRFQFHCQALENKRYDAVVRQGLLNRALRLNLPR